MEIENREKIDILLTRILSGSAEPSEIDSFSEWIKDFNNERYFEQFKEMWHVAKDIPPDNKKTQQAHQRYLRYIKSVKRRQRTRRRFIYTISSAAAVLLIFFFYIAIERYDLFRNYSNISFAELKYNTDSIKVELSDGVVVNPLKEPSGIIRETGSEKIIRDPLNIRQISYLPVSGKNNVPLKSDSLKYNTVTIPAGERFVIVLSDGTKVYLNSNSYLRYPVTFGEESRDVTLSGRAYFDVTKSEVPFIVSTTDMKVEVLGTSFDVETKGQGESSSVILVEGSVKVSANGQTKIISPNEKFSINPLHKEVSVSNIDSKTMTLWKDGILVLKELSFDEMIESLCSWYGVEIIDKASVPDNERFNGKFDREDIKAAMKTIALSAKVKYRIRDGKLIIEDAK